MIVGCYFFGYSVPTVYECCMYCIRNFQFNIVAILHRTKTCELNVYCEFLQGCLVGLLLQFYIADLPIFLGLSIFQR